LEAGDIAVPGETGDVGWWGGGDVDGFAGMEQGMEVAEGFGGGVLDGAEGGDGGGVFCGLAGCYGEMGVGGTEGGQGGVGEEGEIGGQG
jgi:hypothetical protein